MQKRTLGTTGIEVSEIGFGMWTIASGWWGEYPEETQIALLQAALDRGINFFNTSNVYGEDGWGEKLFAKAFAGRRDDVVVATTVGYDVDAPREGSGHKERPHDWSVANIRGSIELSLTNLGVDTIDVLQLHNPRMDAMHNDALWDELEKLKAEGLVKAIGPSIGPKIGWRDEGVFAIENRPIDFIHHIYNMLEQTPGREFTELAASKDIAILVRVPHSSGLLEDKFDLETKFDANDHRSHRPQEWLTEGLQKVEQLRFLQDGREATMGQIAISWLLSDPGITCVQPNFYNLEQIEEFVTATDIDPFDADELGDVDALFAENFGVEPAAKPAPAHA